jgi:hypothetical protein
MTFDIQKILQSKREFRRDLAALPIEEKLRLLDVLRERQLAFRAISKTDHPQIHADQHRFRSVNLKSQSDAS